MKFTNNFAGFASLAPSQFVSTIQGLPWDHFDPKTDLVPLRDLLLQWEAIADGTTEAHRLASEKIKAHLRLQNPAGHETGITCFAIKPDGQYLATGSWVGDDYNAGGHILIWEVATGRCVARIHADGGTGWPDYAHTLQWHPDRPLLGVAYDTNCVGAVDPFEDSWKMGVYITDGWSRPPAFCWTPDGNGMYIACWDENAGHLDSETGPWNNPGVWVDLATEECKGSGTGKTNWKDDLQPHQQCHPYGKHIVGVNSHDQLYASNPEKGIFWSKKAAEAWFGRHYFAYLDERELIVCHGAALKETFKISKVKPLHCCISDAGQNPTVTVLQAKNLLVYRAGKQIADIAIPKGVEAVAYDHPDLQKCSLSPNGEYCAVLDAKGTVTVWHLKGEANQVLELEDADAAGVFVTDDGHIVLGNEEYLAFYPLKGQRLSRYTFLQPEVESPLVVKGVDWKLRTFSEYPTCPVQVGDDQQWALVFEEGAVVVPDGVMADDLFAFSIANRHSWPLRWSKVPVFDSLGALCEDRNVPVYDDFRAQFLPQPKALKVPASDTDGLPLGGATSRQDILEEYERLLDGLGKTWHFAVDDKYGRLALYRMEQEPQYDPLPLLKKIRSAAKAITWAAQCAWWMIEKRKIDVKSYLDLVRERLPLVDKYEKSEADSMAGGLMVRMGVVEEGESLLKRGKAGIKDENNPGEAICPYLRGLLLAGKSKEMLAALRKHEDVDFLDRSSGHLLTWSVILYGDNALIADYFKRFEDEGELDDFQVLYWYAEWISRENLVEKITPMDDLFSGLSTMVTQLECAQRIYQNGSKEKALAWFKEKLDDPKENESDYMDILFALDKLEPKMAIHALLNPNYSAAKALKGLYSEHDDFLRKYLYLLSKHAKLTPEKFKEQFHKTLQPELGCYALLGVLDTLGQGEDRWRPFLELGAQYAAKVKGDAFRPWTELSAKAYQAGFKDLGTEFKKEAKASMGKSPGEFDLEAMVGIYANAGLFDEAYAIWLSIKKGSRNHRMEGLCEALFKAGEYTAVLFMVERLEATDINHRPSALGRLIFGVDGNGYASLD